MDACDITGLPPAAGGAAEGARARGLRGAPGWLPGALAAGAAVPLALLGAGRPPAEGGLLLRVLAVAAAAFLFSFALTPLAARLARRLGILDVPDARKIHARPTPLLGGAAVFLGFLAGVLGAGEASPQLAAMLTAAFVLFVAGVFDDRREIAAAVKLFVQALCTLMVMASGIVLRVLPAAWGPWSEAGNGLLTFLWIVGLTNAFNFFDGMDGLAAGLGVMIASFLAAAAFQSAAPAAGWVAVALAGGCLGFLPFNFRPGKAAAVFLGDAGSTVIGFVLATLAVHGEWSENRPLVSFLCPILIFWVPIFDMVHITCDRILSGKVRSFRGWIEYVGRDHLHHRLADLLGSRSLAVATILLLSAGFGLNALVLRETAAAGVALLCAQSVLFVVGVTILERRGRRTIAAQNGGRLAVAETAAIPPADGARAAGPSGPGAAPGVICRKTRRGDQKMGVEGAP